jgi:hypothetical protein
MLVPSAQAAAENEILYRVVVFELGETARRLSTDEQVGLCSVVNILADALEETR